jgi:hypothetical protein
MLRTGRNGESKSRCITIFVDGVPLLAMTKGVQEVFQSPYQTHFFCLRCYSECATTPGKLKSLPDHYPKVAGSIPTVVR